MNKNQSWSHSGIHLLIDPDKWKPDDLRRLLRKVPQSVSSLIVGGTYIHGRNFEPVMKVCRETDLVVANMLSVGPLDSLVSKLADVVIVPVVMGSTSTRHVLDHLIQAAPVIKANKQEVFSVAYLMLDGGNPTSASFFTQTLPIPRSKPEILLTLSLAATFLGLNGIYLEAGSGARNPITPDEVSMVAKDNSDTPILVGGGISSLAYCHELLSAGASGIIVGTFLEEEKNLSWLEIK